MNAFLLLLGSGFLLSTSGMVESTNPFPRDMDKRLVGAWVARQRPNIHNSNTFHVVYLYDVNLKGEYEYLILEDRPKPNPPSEIYYRPVMKGTARTSTTQKRVYLQLLTPSLNPQQTNTYQTFAVDFRSDGGVALKEISPLYARNSVKAGKIRGQIVERDGIETVQITATAKEQLDWLDSIQGKDELWFMEVARMRRLEDLKRLPYFRETYRDQSEKQMAAEGFIKVHVDEVTGAETPITGPDPSWDEIPVPATNQASKASN